MEKDIAINNKVLISGAGIAGLTLAYWLSTYGFTPTLIERAPTLRTGGYVIDFWGVGYEVAERMDLIPPLRRAGYKLREVRIVDGSGKRIAGFGTQSFGRALKDRYLSILRGDLAQQIYGAVEGKVEILFDDEVCELNEDGNGITVDFARASSRRFDLVIGADGLYSVVRRLGFGRESSFETYLGYGAASFAANGYPHRDENAYIAYCEPGKQVARFALRDGRTVFFLIFAAADWPPVCRHVTAAQKRALHQIFDRVGWECPAILQALDQTEELYMDAVSQIRMDRWHRGRLALIGDAAFCPSLLAGQGAAFAMASAYLLAGELKRVGGDFRIAYPAYQDRFKPFIERKQREAAKFAHQFVPKTHLGLFVRNIMTRLMDAPLIGQLMVKQLFADQFTLPEQS